MAAEVKRKIDPRKVLLLGQENFDSPREREIVESFGLTVINPGEAKRDCDAALKWLGENKITNLAVHLDLDVLNPANFYSQLTRDPFATERFPTVTGLLDLRQITRLLLDVSSRVNVVALTIAEYMPWDALYLSKMMERLPIMR